MNPQKDFQTLGMTRRSLDDMPDNHPMFADYAKVKPDYEHPNP